MLLNYLPKPILPERDHKPTNLSQLLVEGCQQRDQVSDLWVRGYSIYVDLVLRFTLIF